MLPNAWIGTCLLPSKDGRFSFKTEWHCHAPASAWQ